MSATERETLCARIDELCAEVERLRGQGERLFDKTLEVGTENSKLRELAARMARALGIGRGWCTRDCGTEFQCDWGHCPIEAALRELGVDDVLRTE